MAAQCLQTNYRSNYLSTQKKSCRKLGPPPYSQDLTQIHWNAGQSWPSTCGWGSMVSFAIKTTWT